MINNKAQLDKKVAEYLEYVAGCDQYPLRFSNWLVAIKGNSK